MVVRIGMAALAASLAAPALGQQAVQWRVQDGGNGHWYVGIREASGIAWVAASAAATVRGGHLATATSEGENQFIVSTVIPTLVPFGGEFGPILGGRYIGGSWVWVTGEPWSFTAWLTGEPSSPTLEPFLHYQLPALGWDDYDGGNGATYNSPLSRFMIEWSADCNGDGRVDYGQIVDGTLADVDADGIPDCCESGEPCLPCEGDVTGNGFVDGIDLAAILGAWGTPGKGEFPADANGDGTVDGQDLALVLNGWGPCR